MRLWGRKEGAGGKDNQEVKWNKGLIGWMGMNIQGKA